MSISFSINHLHSIDRSWSRTCSVSCLQQPILQQ